MRFYVIPHPYDHLILYKINKNIFFKSKSHNTAISAMQQKNKHNSFVNTNYSRFR